MQLVADLIDALLRFAGDFITQWWPSLLLLALLVPLLHNRTFRLRAPRPAVAYTLIALIAFAAAVLRTLSFGEPHPPWFADDFGYLIEADSFMHGRLTTPTHPMYPYFEALYVMQRPSYAPMYPPGVPLLLALGRLLYGRPVFGLWLGCAAAAVAISWAVAAIASREVAWVIGIFCAIHPMIVQSPANMHTLTPGAIGGALAVGGALRLPRVTSAIAMGVGLAILANVRPYEGLYIAAAAFAFAWRHVRGLAIALATMLVLLTFTFLQNRAVTGSPFHFAYTTYIAQYASAPNLVWQHRLPPRAYPTPEMERTYRIFLHYWERLRQPHEFLLSCEERVREMVADSLGFGVTWSDSLRLFAGLPFFFGLRQKKIVAAIVLFMIGIVQIVFWPQPHYLAPAAALVAILYAGGLQWMIDRGEPALAYACVFTAILSAIVCFHASMGEVPMSDAYRSHVVEMLDKHRGPQLVIAGDRCTDVVYNGAEIDAQHVVFAHDAPGGLAPLLHYYDDRDVWRLGCEPFSFTHVRSPLVAPKRAKYERDIFCPYKFPGRMRQSSP